MDRKSYLGTSFYGPQSLSSSSLNNRPVFVAVVSCQCHNTALLAAPLQAFNIKCVIIIVIIIIIIIIISVVPFNEIG